MKRRLQKMYWYGISITLLLALVAVALIIRIKIEDTRSNLRAILQTASAWTLESNDDLQELSESIASVSPPIRVTFLLNHGLVLADSENDALAMENHASRPEIVEAAEGGVGDSLRISQTHGTFVFYAAKRISPQLILRLAYPLDEITRLLWMYGCGLVVLVIVLFLLQRYSLGSFAGSMVRQMDDVRRLLSGEVPRVRAEFPELQPMVDEIAFLAGRLREDVQEVNRTLSMRNDFVANASHELRSPLTSIMGFAEMLDEGLADTPEEQAVCTQTIRSECQRMLDVIEDILRLSRAERQPAQNAESVDVTAIAGEICQALAPRAARKDISLRVEGMLSMNAAEKDVWEIIYNLADNAVRYGREGGYVRIGLSPGSIVVEDDGIGIDKVHQARIFEQFYRVDEARDAAVGGTGLGLSIVRAIAQRCGGDIRVESEPDKGSRFIVEFAATEGKT